ncbi:MAG: MotA/TolQ/ExbB proton channel family protein [Verrucomicrobiota bacterium]|nr:MotA/TolQ/ExbB proton channel family protein [Verrucomicrobiota bacterium]
MRTLILSLLFTAGLWLHAAQPATNLPSTNGAGTNAPGDGNADNQPGTNAPKKGEGEEKEKEEEKTWLGKMLESGPIGLLVKGGWFMLPILLLAIVAFGVIIERWRSLKMLGTDKETLRQAVLDDLTNDRVQEALARCEAERGPVAAVIANGLRKYFVLRKLNYDPARLEEQVVKSMENYGVHIVAALERHLSVLAIVSSVAPMLGFLGTVAGMIESFDQIVKMDKGELEGATSIVAAAADDISVALLTTCFGLMVGIPAFMAFNYFSSVINKFVLEVEESSSELMEAVTLQLTLNEAGTRPSRE